MAINYESFNQTFFENGAYPILWFNRKGIIQLDKERNAEITLVTNGVHRNYAGYQVQIIHKHNGTITGHYFGFSEFMKNRIDQRSNWNGSFHIYEDIVDPSKNKWWYIAIPSPNDVDNMVEKITTFISLYE